MASTIMHLLHFSCRHSRPQDGAGKRLQKFPHAIQVKKEEGGEQLSQAHYMIKVRRDARSKSPPKVDTEDSGFVSDSGVLALSPQ